MYSYGGDKMTIKLETHIEEAASTDKSRPQLRGVYHDAQNGKIVAADGWIMAVVPVKSDGDDSAIVGLDTVKEAWRANKRGPELELSKNEVKFEEATGIVTSRTVEGHYPDYQQIIPKDEIGDEGTITIALNPSLLLRLAKAMGASGKRSGVAITVRHVGNAMIVRPINGDVPKAFGVIMPMHGGEDYRPEAKDE
jgi:hypothetical protein